MYSTEQCSTSKRKCSDKTAVQPATACSNSHWRYFHTAQIGHCHAASSRLGRADGGYFNIIAASIHCPQHLLSNRYEYSSAINFVFYCNRTKINELEYGSLLHHCYKTEFTPAYNALSSVEWKLRSRFDLLFLTYVHLQFPFRYGFPRRLNHLWCSLASFYFYNHNL